ncbi:MAG: PhzF family phenazine biosynthesis protein [Planctomycetota bacterium]
MTLPFVTVDVFTTEPFGGNPLAVVLNADALNDADMQRIAMEFNLSETTFIRTPKDPANAADGRIFTPRAEIPFAGHPNVGTAFVLASSRDDKPSDLVFEGQAGLVRLSLLRDDDGTLTGAELAAPQVFARGEDFSPEQIAEVLALPADQIETANHLPCVISCGTPFATVEVKSREVLANARVRTDAYERHLPTSVATGLHVYTRDAGEGFDAEVRMFAPTVGVPEDPATGSANIAWMGLMASLENASEGHFSRVVSQGVDMGRPSVMHCKAEKVGGEVLQTWIGGSVVPMMTGIIDPAGS